MKVLVLLGVGFWFGWFGWSEVRLADFIDMEMGM
jgi:predicted negative regulator of RcsB-dependent stress response